MKAVVSRADLLRAAETAGAASVRSSMPILGHTLLSASPGSLRLTTNNTDQVIDYSVAAEIADGAATTLPTDDLRQFAARCPDGCQIEIADTEKGRVVLRAGRARLTLPTLPAADFPKWRDEAGRAFKIEAETFRAMIGHVAWATSKDKKADWAAAVNIVRAGPSLRFVATDRHSLARAEMPAPSGTEDVNATLPMDLIAHLLKAPSSGEATVSLGEGFDFACGQLRIRSRLLTSGYPDIDRIIPADSKAVATVDVKRLSDALRRLSLAANDADRTVSLEIGSRSIVARTPYARDRDAEEEIDAQGPSSPILIGFNIGKLIAQLDGIDSETADFAIRGTTEPVMITAPGRDGYLQILMPVRVPDARRKAA